MGDIVVTEFISIDGVIEDPGGSEDFAHGAWTFDYSGPEQGKYKFDETMASDAQLLGRVTYEGFAAAWPERDDEAGFAAKFNEMPKIVVSTTLENPAWNNTRVEKGDLADVVRRLKDEFDGDIVVHGSATLARSLLAEDLVDELRLMVFPTVLGSGKRLFGESDRIKLALASAQPFESGVTVLTYRRAA